MKKKIDPKYFAQVIGTLMSTGARSAVKYIDPNTVVKATWHWKPMASRRSETMVVTCGAPNCREREFVKLCKQAGEPFPVKKIQIKGYTRASKDEG